MALGDGEHHNAAVATLDFLGNRDRISSLRLYPHAEADKKAAKQVLKSDEANCRQRGEAAGAFAKAQQPIMSAGHGCTSENPLPPKRLRNICRSLVQNKIRDPQGAGSASPASDSPSDQDQNRRTTPPRPERRENALRRLDVCHVPTRIKIIESLNT